jgi:hypothetical protein
VRAARLITTAARQRKAQDTLGVPGTATSITNVLNATTGHARSIGIGPNAQVQATYDNGIAFVIQQNSSVKTGSELAPDQAVSEPTRPALTEAEAFPCFRSSVWNDYDGMAAGAYSNLEQFNRIRVDLGQPLAAWLQENTRTAGMRPWGFTHRLRRPSIRNQPSPADAPRRRWAVLSEPQWDALKSDTERSFRLVNGSWFRNPLAD